MLWSSAIGFLQNGKWNQNHLGVLPHSENDKFTERGSVTILQHWLFLLTGISSSYSLCPLWKENILEWRPGPTLFLTREGRTAPGCLAATCFSSVGTLILIMDSLEQLDSSAPTEPAALRKEAEVLKGGMVCLITRQRASRIFRCTEFYVQTILYFQSFDP